MNQKYAHYMGTKFISLQVGHSVAWVNVSAVSSVSKAVVPDKRDMTAIGLINGNTYYTEATVAEVMDTIVERAS